MKEETQEWFCCQIRAHHKSKEQYGYSNYCSYFIPYWIIWIIKIFGKKQDYFYQNPKH